MGLGALNASPAKKSMLMLPSRKSLFSRLRRGSSAPPEESSGGSPQRPKGAAAARRARAIAEGSATVTPRGSVKTTVAAPAAAPPAAAAPEQRSAPDRFLDWCGDCCGSCVRSCDQLGSIFSDSTRGLRGSLVRPSWVLVRALLAVSIALQYAGTRLEQGASLTRAAPHHSPRSSLYCRYAAGVSFPPTISPWPNRRFWTNLGDYLQLGNSTLGGAVCERLLPEDAIVHARASEDAEGGQVLSDVICWFGTDGYLSPSWLIPEFLALVACTLHVNFGSAPMEANKARRWMRWSQGGGGLEGTLESPLATPRGPDARAESWEERVLKEGMWLYAVEELMLRSSHFIALIFIFLLTCFSNFSDSQG